MRLGTILILTAAALYVMGCNEDGLVSPELTQSEHMVADDQATRFSKAGKWRSFTATQVNTAPSPPEMRFTGNGRVLHARGAAPSGDLAGDIQGTYTSNWNGDAVLKDGVYVGPSRGTVTWTVTHLFGEEVSGTFEIRAHGFNALGVSFTGSLRGTGTGELDGMKLTGTFEPSGAPRTFTLSGYILDPKG